MSARSDVVDMFVKYFKDNRLDDSYGVSECVREVNGKKFHEITFCIARILDGIMRVYSPTFIMVKWQTQYRDMPHKGQEVFKSVEEAKQFIDEKFVRG